MNSYERCPISALQVYFYQNKALTSIVLVNQKYYIYHESSRVNTIHLKTIIFLFIKIIFIILLLKTKICFEIQKVLTHRAWLWRWGHRVLSSDVIADSFFL